MHAQEHASFDADAPDTGPRRLAPARAVMPAGTDDAAICFVDRDAGTPLAYRPYRLRIGARLLLGRTDADGLSAVLTSLERAALSEWEVE
jgi:hypothetical protein